MHCSKPPSSVFAEHAILLAVGLASCRSSKNRVVRRVRPVVNHSDWTSQGMPPPRGGGHIGPDVVANIDGCAIQLWLSGSSLPKSSLIFMYLCHCHCHHPRLRLVCVCHGHLSLPPIRATPYTPCPCRRESRYSYSCPIEDSYPP